MTGAAPLWTRARLGRVMRLRFGDVAAGKVNTSAAASEMGVSQRTVQRWLHARHGRTLAHIPEARLAQLTELLLPAKDTRAKEAQQARYADKAIDQLRLGRKMGIKPAWEKQRWLEEHLVVVLEVKIMDLKIRQLAIGRASLAKMDEFRRRGTVVDQAVVPTRFHATVLTHRVLTELEPWRFQAGADQVVQGFTQAWLADAPATHLGRWGQEIPATRGRR